MTLLDRLLIYGALLFLLWSNTTFRGLFLYSLSKGLSVASAYGEGDSPECFDGINEDGIMELCVR